MENKDNPIISLNNALPDTPVSSLDAMQAVVRADGDLDLAAVRLRTKKANVLAAIVTDPHNHDTLSRYFRAHQVIKMFGLIETITSHLEPQLDNLNARDLSKVLLGLLETFAAYTAPAAQPLNAPNPVESTLKLFPPHVQEAIRHLANAQAAQSAAPTQSADRPSESEVKVTSNANS